jgi:hypothetical protein
VVTIIQPNASIITIGGEIFSRLCTLCPLPLGSVYSWIWCRLLVIIIAHLLIELRFSTACIDHIRKVLRLGDWESILKRLLIIRLCWCWLGIGALRR